MAVISALRSLRWEELELKASLAIQQDTVSKEQKEDNQETP